MTQNKIANAPERKAPCDLTVDKRYNLVNNILGWTCFLIAAVTYLLTIEPTASFWDCPEFIIQGAKLDIGHPPGNPIFMLTARFFVTIFGGDMHNAALAINTMSALFSAATILLLFWTVTHLVRKVMVSDDSQVSIPQMIVIMAAGICGALAYTWSDTFWFSAVESEVYAFSSFCTALVFWLILKWENRADQPHSDRYLVLIAYIIGVSIAVHLLNLLCIPAIVLVFYFRKMKNINLTGSLQALLVSFALVAVILFGLVPGYIKVAQSFELFFVNVLGMSYNMGALIYAIVLMGVYIYTIKVLYSPSSATVQRIMMYLSLALSGLVFITRHPLVWVILSVALAVYMFVPINTTPSKKSHWVVKLAAIFTVGRDVPTRVFRIIALSLAVIFIGYSSYALLLIRASANPPMNQNAPDNVFTLASYLNREQYGQTPLLYGPIFTDNMLTEGYIDYDRFTGEPTTIFYVPLEHDGKPRVTVYDNIMRTAQGVPVDHGENIYSRVAKTSPDETDRYVMKTWKPDYSTPSETNMLFTRMYSNSDDHVPFYKSWSGYNNKELEEASMILPRKIVERGYLTKAEALHYFPGLIEVHSRLDDNGEKTSYTDLVWKPSMFDNLSYFFNYQLNHMYWRYFMWNFAGRQNDIQGNGEPFQGNWISGIPFIDNARLGDQSLLPEIYTTGNKGHNVFYMLPLLLGILGIIWQAMMQHRKNPDRGIEQFWVVFFLFFMTGVAIVLYLNQPPSQPRERDYAFAGSFYAFSIWIGMGVPAIARIVTSIFTKKAEVEASAKEDRDLPLKPVAIAVAAVAAVGVPLQMVSQTWDDHDRSHRYTTRDFGANYLYSLDDNAVIFTNGDNDTFPLWYAQEVEGIRPDVRVVNLSYLSTDWYANQMKQPSEGKPVVMTAQPSDYAYDKLQVTYVNDNGSRLPALDALKQFYANPKGTFENSDREFVMYRTPRAYAPIDTAAVMRAFNIDPNSADSITKLPYLSDIDMPGLRGNGFALNTLLSFDIVANSIAGGFERPVYFASTVPSRMYLGMQPNLALTGMAYQVTPFADAPTNPLADKAYENIVSRYRWGGLDDEAHNSGLYLDETVRRMVSSIRHSMITTASDLIYDGNLPATDFAIQWAKDNNLPVPQDRYDMGRYMLNLMEQKIPARVVPLDGLENLIIPEYLKLYSYTGNADDLQRAKDLIDKALDTQLRFAAYATSMASTGNPGYYSLGTTAQQARINIPVLLSYLNYIDMVEAANGDETKLKYIDRVMNIDDLYTRWYLGAPLVYLEDFTPAELAASLSDVDPDDRTAAEYRNALSMMLLNQELNIDWRKNASDLLSKYGLTPDDVLALDVFLR